MTHAGRHLLLDLHACDPVRLDDESLVATLLRDAADAAGARVLHVHTHHFEPHGVTGFALLAESHVSIHTWPERGYAAVDLYTCGTGDLERACDVLANALGAQNVCRTLLLRGVDAER